MDEIQMIDSHRGVRAQGGSTEHQRSDPVHIKRGHEVVTGLAGAHSNISARYS